MKNNRKFEFKQKALQAGVCLFMLSGTSVLYAQEANTTDAEEAAPVRKEKKAVVPTYQMKEITGKVFDAATNKPMGGVRIQALNNNFYAAITDEDGSYKISVPVFVHTLYFSASDYSPIQLSIKGDANQNVNLYSDKFATIYQNGTELLAKGSTKLDNSSALTVESELENKLNGDVRTISRGGMPGQGAAMFIRGLNSLNSIAQPLVVVDGVVWDMQYDRTSLHTGFVNNVLNLIDTEDIENVEVIKNGTALYGAKGANGVIEIKTKRGSSMVTRINARVFGGFELAPSTTDVMNGKQYRSYLTSLFGTMDIGEDMASSTTIPFLNEDPSYPFYKKFHNNTDWSKDLYHTAFTQNYKINVEGGDDMAMYNLSLGYSLADATAKQSGFDRLNIRFNTDIKLSTKLTTALDFSYARVAYDLRDNGWASDYSESNISSPNVLGLIQAPFLSNYSYYTKWDAENQVNYVELAKDVYAGKYVSTDANDALRFAESYGTDALANPYWILLNGKGENRNFQEQTLFNVNAKPQYQLNRNLTISDRFSYSLNRTSEKYYLPVSGTPNKFVEGLGNVNSTIKTQFGKEISVYNDFRIDWKKQMGEHYLNLFGGFRLSSFNYSDSYVKGYNNSNDKMPNLSYNLQYLSYGGSNDSWLNLAYYANADYNYLNRYFVKGQLALESSSRFGKEAEEGIKMFGVQWGVFPSLQAAWVISAEPWFDVKAVNYLKLTAGYEETGNDNIDYYASRTYFENVKFMDRATALMLANIENSTIQWETNRRFNIGLQSSLLDNRLMLGVDFFHSKTSNLLTKKEISYIVGLPYMWANDGELKNTGVEANVSGILVNTKDWKWSAGFTLGHYKNEITKLAEGNEIKLYELDQNGSKIMDRYKTIKGYTSSIYGKDNILTAVGQAAGVFYGYKTAGVFSTDAEAARAHQYIGAGGEVITDYLKYPTGIVEQPYRNFRAGDVHFIDQNGDGWISEADMVKIGDPNPDLYGNIFTSLSYKGWKLDLNFKYSLGNDIFNYQRSQLESANNAWNQTTAVVNRWSYEGQKTAVPRAMATSSDEWVNNERFSDRWIEDGSYLKLKKVRLTYKLPVSLSWLQGVTVWGEANDVFTITKYLGSDPEVTAGNNVLYQGIDNGMLPLNRNFNLGVTLNL